MLLGQRHKTQAALLGGPGQAQAHIGLARSHRGGHSAVRGLFKRQAVQLRHRQALLGQQLLQQHLGARALGAAGKAGLGVDRIAQVVQLQGVAGCHHQAHLALGKAHHLVQTRLQQGPVMRGGDAPAFGLIAGVKASHHAAAFVQGADGVHTAAKAHIQVQALGSAEVLQAGQRVVVAGVQGEHMGLRVKGHGKAALQLGAQGLDLGR